MRRWHTADRGRRSRRRWHKYRFIALGLSLFVQPVAPGSDHVFRVSGTFRQGSGKGSENAVLRLGGR